VPVEIAPTPLLVLVVPEPPELDGPETVAMAAVPEVWDVKGSKNEDTITQ
jgi:hypothetical protein